MLFNLKWWCNHKNSKHFGINLLFNSTAITLPSSTWNGVHCSVHQRMHMVSVAASCLNALNHRYSRSEQTRKLRSCHSSTSQASRALLSFPSGALFIIEMKLLHRASELHEVWVLSPSLEPGPSAQAFAGRMTVRMWKHWTHSRRKDTGVEIIHRRQAGDLHGVGREEPAHGHAPALLSVPARGWRTINPLVPLLPHPRLYLQKLENKSCHVT